LALIVGAFYMTFRVILAITAIIFVILFLLIRKNNNSKRFSSKFLTRTAIFAAISIILYIVPFLNFQLPFFPPFLNIHFDEIPAFIAGFAYGPLSGFFVIVIKTIAKFPMTTTGGVGEIADLVYSCAFVLPAAFIYAKKKTFKNVILAFSISTIIQLVVSSLLTSFVMLDFYIFIMGMPKESILAMCQAVNPAVTSLGWTFRLLVALPFNLFKDIAVILLTAILYKKLHSYIDRFEFKA
jgi:riboflavin transporter FmnP